MNILIRETGSQRESSHESLGSYVNVWNSAQTLMDPVLDQHKIIKDINIESNLIKLKCEWGLVKGILFINVRRNKIEGIFMSPYSLVIQHQIFKKGNINKTIHSPSSFMRICYRGKRYREVMRWIRRSFKGEGRALGHYGSWTQDWFLVKWKTCNLTKITLHVPILLLGVEYVCWRIWHKYNFVPPSISLKCLLDIEIIYKITKWLMFLSSLPIL